MRSWICSEGHEIPLQMKHSKCHPHSLAFYSLVFLGLVGGVFLLVAGIGLYSARDFDSELQQTADRLARRELGDVITGYAHSWRRMMTEFVNWDEVRQQIANPVYYPYWRGHRLREYPSLPEGLVGVELYNAEGRMLARLSDSRLPSVLPQEVLDPQGHLAFHSDRRVWFVEPVLNEGGEVLGYAAMKLDLLALLRGHHFRYLIADSLKLPPVSTPVPLAKLPELFRFRMPPSPELHVLKESLNHTLLLAVLAVLVLALVFYLAALRLLRRPLERLLQAVRGLQDDPEVDLVLDEPLPLAELDEIRAALNTYQSRLSQVHRHLDRKNQELWELAYHDGLTGAYNRRAFDEHWNALLGTVPGSRMSVSLVLFDCNHFKAINDSYGHQVGDLVLQALAGIIQQTLRSGDNLYRVGGDEFALIMLDADVSAARRLAERVVESLRRFDFTQLGLEEPVRMSIGIASAVAEEAEGLRNLYWEADLAMYHAKRPGYHNIAVYSDEMKNVAGSVFSSQTIATVTDAIATGRHLVMYYQPIVSLGDDQVVYYEALVRIQGEEGIISPAEIFQIVESRRLERELDQAVFRRVRQDLEEGVIPAGSGVSINVSGPSVIDPQLFEWLEPMLRFVDDYHITLEVTETSLIRQLYEASRSLERLRAAGFKVALDDFGSGYSSLRYLASMPVDVVKFDIALIRGLAEPTRQAQVIEGLVSLIRMAGYPMVAEGIEDEETLERVRRLGFDFGQGYHLGRPAPLSVPQAATKP